MCIACEMCIYIYICKKYFMFTQVIFGQSPVQIPSLSPLNSPIHLTPNKPPTTPSTLSSPPFLVENISAHKSSSTHSPLPPLVDSHFIRRIRVVPGHVYGPALGTKPTLQWPNARPTVEAETASHPHGVGVVPMETIG